MDIETSFPEKGSLVFQMLHTYLDKKEKINVTVT